MVSLDPKSLGDVLGDIRRVAQATGTVAIATPIIAALPARIDAVVAAAQAVSNKPRVLHLEWAEPPMCGGHWVPEMVEMAGGVNCFGSRHEGSFQLNWTAVIESQPEVILLMPCGFDVKRALEDVPVLAAKDGWDTLPAVQNNRVYVMDAGAYTSRSGPRLVLGLEMIAELLHPDRFAGMIPETGAQLVSPSTYHR